LEVVDVSNPTNMVWITGATVAGSAQDVEVMGRYVLVAADSAGLQILELQQSIYPPLMPPVISGGMMTLTWPYIEGIRLQKCTNLAIRVWQDVAGSEHTNTVTLPIRGGSEFFRLLRP
jgi:hypothetical protein